MEEKIMKRITEETQENLEKGAQEPPQKNSWTNIPVTPHLVSDLLR